MRKTWIIPIVALTAVLTVLAQSWAWEEGLGKLPPVVVHLYDSGAADGWIEIEADRDGTILEAETHISVDALPARVLAVAKRQLDGEVTGAEMELTRHGRAWEVQMTKNGLGYEFVVDDEGNVIEKEIEIAKSDWPKNLVNAATMAIPGGSVRSVERIEHGDAVEYHVKLARGGASYKVVLGPKGTVRRKVREAKVELEIPLP